MNADRKTNLTAALGGPSAAEIDRSRKGVDRWFAQAAPVIRWDRLDTPIGTLYVAVTEAGLRRVGFSQPEESFFAQLDPLARTERDPHAVERIAAQMVEYFAGRRRTFEVTLDWRGVGAFQRRVLEAALTIPPGRTLTYQQVARAIGQPKSSRAVGQALARNPIPVVVPCHRVLGSDGSLHGYAGGLERKATLLRLEGAL